MSTQTKLKPESKTIPVREAVALAIAVIEREGKFVKTMDRWIGDKEQIPTSVIMHEHYNQDKETNFTLTDAHYQEADETIQFLKGLAYKSLERPLSDFESNVLKIVAKPDMLTKSIGIIASLPSVYRRSLAMEEWADREAKLSRKSNFVGTLRERARLDNLTIENVRELRNGSNLYCASDANENIVKWFSEGMPEVKQGNTVSITAYIKDHSESKFHGGKETMVNRVRLEENSVVC